MVKRRSHDNQPQLKEETPNGPLDLLYIFQKNAAGLKHAAIGRLTLYGLYDTDGILRFVGGDLEACEAYAELFEIPTVECCLMSLPEPNSLEFNEPKKIHRRAMSNN